ncbi:MAG: ubiquinone/menaquinone biosynthesis methyltransferase [Gemmatimonadota bacterium]
MTHESRIGERIRTPGAKREYVRTLFGRVARRYDLTNDVMSLGLHRRWKRLALALAEVGPGDLVLDLAAGTGDFSLRVVRQTGARTVVAADLTREMMAVGRARRRAGRVRWVQCDAMDLPFASGSVDRVLIGYGLRNFPDLSRCLAEIARCLRPGGRLVSLDFGRMRSPRLDRAYLKGLRAVAGAAGWLLHRDVESYVYIPESLRRYPPQESVTGQMRAAGFERCGHIDLLYGAMALHFGERAAGT